MLVDGLISNGCALINGLKIHYGWMDGWMDGLISNRCAVINGLKIHYGWMDGWMDR